MRIELRRSGGFAGNIRRPPLVVDTSALPAAEALELEALAEAALAGAPPERPARGADRLQLELAVEHEGRMRTLAFGEAGASEELHALVRRVRELAG